MVKIAVVGSSNTDMAVKVPHIPGLGETVLGGEFVMAAGGKGANQAVAARRLGAEVALVACLGDDLFGQRSLTGLRREDIDVEHVRVVPQASGVALIMVDASGENVIAVAPGANTHLSPKDVEDSRSVISGSDVLLLQLEVDPQAVLRAAQVAGKAGVTVILNPAPVPDDCLPLELFEWTDIVTPNEHEARKLTGIARSRGVVVAARRLRAFGVGSVIVTLGAKGALLVTSEREQRVPGLNAEVIDATAAGDAFNGALAVALARKLPLADAVQFANAAGAFATTRLGAQPSLPTQEELNHFLEELDAGA